MPAALPEKIPTTRVQRELEKVVQVPVGYNIQRDYPYTELGSRSFELLLYSVFERGIESGRYQKEFDEARLVQAPGGGRETLLLYEGKVRGLVIAATRRDRLTLPALARDIMRFAMHALSDQFFEFDPLDFKLFYAAGGGMSGRALAFAADLNSRLTADERFSAWTQEVMESDAKLEKTDLKAGEEKFRKLLETLDLELILPEHLDDMLNGWPDLRSVFFGVELVTSEQLLKRLVNRFNVTELGEDEAQRLMERLERIPEDHRMGIGLMNFFGYPRAFVEHIATSDKLRTIMIKGAEFKAEIDYAMVDFLQRRAEFFSSVMLTERGDIGALARLAVAPYMFSKFTIKYVKNANSKTLSELIRNSREYEFYENASIDQIRDKLIKECLALAAEPAPASTGSNPRDVVRQERLRQAVADLADKAAGPDVQSRGKPAEDQVLRDRLAEHFDRDWESLKPTLTAIEKKMIALLPHDATIVFEDMSALDDDNRFGRFMRTLRMRLGRKS